MQLTPVRRLYYTFAMASAASRSGSPSISVQTLIDRLARHKDEKKPARELEIAKLAEYVSADDAQDALRTLELRKPSRYLSSAVLGAGAAPAVKFMGDLTEAVVDRRHGGAHLRDALKGGLALAREKNTLGRIAGNAVTGALGGGAVKSVSEGFDAHAAKKTLRDFMHEPKSAAMVSPGRASGMASSAAKAATVGRAGGMTSATALKPPGSVTAGVIKPTASIAESAKPRTTQTGL